MTHQKTAYEVLLVLLGRRRGRKQSNAALYSRSPKNPALQLLLKSSKSASTTPQRPIWNTFGTVAVRDFWENDCGVGRYLALDASRARVRRARQQSSRPCTPRSLPHPGVPSGDTTAELSSTRRASPAIGECQGQYPAAEAEERGGQGREEQESHRVRIYSGRASCGRSTRPQAPREATIHWGGSRRGTPGEHVGRPCRPCRCRDRPAVAPAMATG